MMMVIVIVWSNINKTSNHYTPCIKTFLQNGIECHWDERRSILYLHTITYLDTKQLTALAATLDDDATSTDKDADAANWLVASGNLAAESCKAIALLFHLCHIVVLSSPTPVFDLGYLQLFKAIDAYR